MRCLPGEGAEGDAAEADRFKGKEVFGMPGFDGTGPMGAGPMTGGGRGYCNPAGVGYAPRYGRFYGWGRGFGAGRGRGFGRGPLRWSYYPEQPRGYVPQYAPYGMDAPQELNTLRAEADSLSKSLNEINRRIQELEEKES